MRKLFHSKPKWAALCSVAFKDKQGRRYYSFNDPLDMSIARKGELERYQMELRYGSDYSDILEGMQQAIGASTKKGEMQPDIVTIGYLIQEFVDRKQMLIIPDIMFRMVSTVLLRDDEQPAVIDEEILEDKVSTFKYELQHGGLLSFFQQSGLANYSGLQGISTIDFKRRISESQARIQSLKSVLHSFEKRLYNGLMTGPST